MEVCIPDISENEYPAFRSLPGNYFPEAFNLWRYETDKRVQDFMANRRTIITVPVKAHEFAAYCRARNVDCNPHNLNHFVFEKASGKKDSG
jgi:hypothetical protein